MAASVTQRFTKAILRQLEAQNIQLPPDLSEKLRVHATHGRLPMAIQDELWRDLAHQDCADLGLRLGLQMRPENFDTVGFLLLTCPSLGVAVNYLIDYSMLIGEGGAFSQSRTAGEWALSYRPNFTVAVALRIETIFASVASGARWVAGKDITPVKVHFTHARRAESQLYAQVFGQADIRFNQPQNTIIYADDAWQAKQRDINPALQTQMLVLANQQLAALKTEGFSDRAYTLMRNQPWLTRTQLSASLAVSERTLTRKLKMAGTSYQKLSDAIRQQHTLGQICLPRVTQAGLAAYFGYCDENAFAKAFRRWTGMGFRAYREQHCQILPKP